MPRVIHFEIPASDPERASAFYKKTFDWKIEKWPGPTEYWLVTTGPFWGHPAPRQPLLNYCLLCHATLLRPHRRLCNIPAELTKHAFTPRFTKHA